MAQAQRTKDAAPDHDMDLEQMQEKALEGIKDARGTIESFAKANPRAAVGVALGIGFMLGGGLTPRLLFGLGAIAARRIVREYARDQIGSFTRGAIGGAPSPRSAAAQG